MKTTQYTIRNIPPAVDSYLRKKAKLTRQSLNQVILQELSQNTSYKPGSKITESLDWFIGSGMEDSVTDALKEEDTKQKDYLKNQAK